MRDEAQRIVLGDVPLPSLACVVQHSRTPDSPVKVPRTNAEPMTADDARARGAHVSVLAGAGGPADGRVDRRGS
jgi:hypothetical protein